MKLRCFAENHWFESTADGIELRSAVNGEPVAVATSEGLDYAGMLHYARTVGGPTLSRYQSYDSRLAR